MKKLIFVIVISLYFALAEPVSAVDIVVSESAQIRSESQNVDFDFRVKVLKDYFERHNSPLAIEAQYFIKYADKYNLDWRLVAAISGVESTFGKRIPPNSYNAYGWANGKYKFQSWEESIEVVSKILREKYYDRGLESIDQIARVYAPPSKTWSWKVQYFMKQIEPLPLTFTL